MNWHYINNIVFSFIPHGHCYLWNSELVLLHAISDALIAIAYFSIPCTLGYFVFKRKDLPYPRIFALFGLFIVSCGVTHALEIWTLWHPNYWVSGLAKAFTAVVSLFTAIELFPIVPQALALTSPAELEVTNQTLKREITERQSTEAELQNSQKLLDNAFQFALIGNAVVTPEGNWIKVNPALCKILGYSAAELLDINFRDITYSEDLEADQNYINQLLSDEINSCQFEKRYIHKQGQIIWVLLSVALIRDFQGQPVSFIAQIQDITERKQTEQKLRDMKDQLELAVKKRTAELELAYAQLKKTAAQYQDLYDYAPDMYVSVDADSMKIVRCNQTLINELGYSKEEVLGRPIFSMYNPDCLTQAEKAFQHFLDAGEVKDSQLVLQRKDGSPLDVSLNVRAIRDKAGNILYSHSSWRDITTQKQLEAQLRQVNAKLKQRVQERTQDLHLAHDSLKKSQEQLNFSLEALGDGWWDWQVQTEEVYWSPIFYQMLGYEDGEIPASYKTWEQLVHPEDLPHVVAILEAHFQDSSVPYVYDYRVRTKSKEWKWIANFGRVIERDDQGHPTRMAGMHHDISDRKRAEAERLKAEQARQELKLLEQILDDVLAGYWDWDILNDREYLSPGFKLMLGYQDHELPNSPETRKELILSEDLPVMLDCFENHVQSRGELPFYHEGRYRHKDGKVIWALSSGQVIEWDEVGQPLRMIGCHVDLSDRIQAEERSRQYAAQLEASNRELEAFAYSVSHDLRAPLRAIDGFSRALLEDYEDLFNEEASDYFDRICKNVVRMSQLIDDLLSLSRVSRSHIHYTPINLSTLAQEVIDQLQTEEPERQVDVVIAPDEIVSADATLMHVVLANLLQNAWKFTQHHATAHIEFGVTELEGQRVYFVRDDGAGFDMTYAHQLFGVFQRLHSAHEFPGTGIGLASVQRAIHRHGGSVWAEATVEKGATFYFSISRLCSRYKKER